MSTTLHQRTISSPIEYISGMIGKPLSNPECANCVLLAEMAPMVREMLALRVKGRIGIATLTDRQREIMHLVVAGHPSKIIAMDLGISQRTVENHRWQIMRRTGTKSLPELSRLVFCASWPVADEPLG